ncbi:hypothetical protein ACLPJK_26410 [Pseudomonas aeruginosa]|uniref:hypothetical protein n=1 Tax=Pseudomonas aeruginosa TaxID=287 RepID=UPI003D2B5506
MSRHATPERDGAWRICKKNYNISVPKWFFRGQAYQDEFGLQVSGDLKHDMAMMHEMIPIRATPLEMAKWFDNGLTKIEFGKPEQTVEIYNDIKDVLMRWANAIPYEVDLPEIDRELLGMLDRFSDGLYSVARRHFKAEPRKPNARDRLLGRGGVIPRQGELKPNPAQPPKPEGLRERSKIIDLINERAHERQRKMRSRS